MPVPHRKGQRDWIRTLAGLACATVVSGCEVWPGSESTPESSAVARRLVPPACDAAPETVQAASTLIVLDWEGGVNPADRRIRLAPLDPAALPVYEGIEPGPDADAFKEWVRRRVETILCGLDPMDMRVILGRAADWPGATHVYFTLDVPLGGGDQVGQADSDPCNRRRDDAVIVWGGRLAALAGDGRRRDQWIHILANVATHETGHTLGFLHPDELGIPIDPSLAGREIMLSSHTIGALSGEQGFMIPQDTCAEQGDSGGTGVRYEVTGRSTPETGTKD